MAGSTRKLKFEEAMQRLEAIVAAMESGEIGIEDSLRKYEEAMALKAHCQRILDEAEQRIQKIQRNEAGELKIEPFEPPAAGGELPGEEDVERDDE